MSFHFILTLAFHLVVGRPNVPPKRHVPNSLIPQNNEIPIYDIGSWVQMLNLQHCAVVEVGENYCALFVESLMGTYGDPDSQMFEFFLGVCDCDTMTRWRFCSPYVEKHRRKDCTLTSKDLMEERVHRRLCDVSGLASWAPACNCSNNFAYAPLLKVTGFPTCFQPPLPQSLCFPRNVCGVAKCNATTIADKIHTATCSKSCLGQRPFCENGGTISSVYRRETSFWSDWSPLSCNTGCGLGRLQAQAACIDRITGKPATDCLGPGTYCCPPDAQHCICRVFNEGGGLKVMRTLTTCVSRRSCEGTETIGSDLVEEGIERPKTHEASMHKYRNIRYSNKISWARREAVDADEDDDDVDTEITTEDDADSDEETATKITSDASLLSRDDLEHKVDPVIKEDKSVASIETLENGDMDDVVMYGITVSGTNCLHDTIFNMLGSSCMLIFFIFYYRVKGMF